MKELRWTGGGFIWVSSGQEATEQVWFCYRFWQLKYTGHFFIQHDIDSIQTSRATKDLFRVKRWAEINQVKSLTHFTALESNRRRPAGTNRCGKQTVLWFLISLEPMCFLGSMQTGRDVFLTDLRTSTDCGFRRLLNGNSSPCFTHVSRWVFLQFRFVVFPWLASVLGSLPSEILVFEVLAGLCLGPETRHYNFTGCKTKKKNFIYIISVTITDANCDELWALV